MSVETGSNITPLFGDQEPSDGPPPTRTRVKKLRLLAIFLPLAVLAVVSTVFGMMMAVASDLPNLENRKEYQDAKNSQLVDAQNRPLGVLTNNQSRVLVGSGDISSYMINAIIAVEDRRFYENPGVDIRGIARAFTQDILQRKTVQGGSTIAQQFVKNALRAQADRTVFQKLREAALAYHLTRKWPKSKILTQYLNSIYFGNGAYGVESAARTYFGNQPDHLQCGTPNHEPCAKRLKPEEAALIAGVVANPSAYDPVAHPAAALSRRNLVLKDMVEQGRIPRLQYFNAIKEPLPAAVDVKPPTVRSEAPYFTTWVRQQLVDRFGARVAFEGGLKIRTTLDLDLQKAANDAVAKYLPDPNGPSAAVVAIDNKTGQVRAMYGGRNYDERPFNLATQGQRQPGSSIKPFILAAALQKGYSPASLWPSRKRVFTVPGTKGKEHFTVNNFESKYAGSQTLAGGLTYSDNAVFSAVGISVGTKKIAKLAERMGIRTPVSSNYAMTLGGLKEGVTPLDMAHAYQTFVAHGRRVGGTLGASDHGPVGIISVDGPNLHEQNEKDLKTVLPQSIADETVSIMTTVVSQGTGRRAALGPGQFVAGKTGTTENSGDAWFVGFNDRWTVAVWVGYPDTLKPMLHEFAGQPVEGGTYPALIWHDFMVAANAKVDERNAKERERKGLPPLDPSAQQQTAPVPPTSVPTKPAPVPEGGDSAPATPQTDPNATSSTGTVPPNGTGTGTGTGTGSGPGTQQQQATPPPAGQTGGAGSGGASAPEG